MNYFHARILVIDAPAPSYLIFGASLFDICKRLARADGIASAQSQAQGKAVAAGSSIPAATRR
jgi:hypothetical protein